MYHRIKEIHPSAIHVQMVQEYKNCFFEVEDHGSWVWTRCFLELLFMDVDVNPVICMINRIKGIFLFYLYHCNDAHYRAHNTVMFCLDTCRHVYW